MPSILERAGSWMAQQIAGYMQTPRERTFKYIEDYYYGNQPPQLKVKAGQDDDNVTLNWLGLAVDRSVSQLISGGVEFEYPEEAEAQDEYIDAVWDTNKRRVLLHDIALDGAVFGTPFIKIVPNGITDPYTNQTFPRLVSLDPKLMTVEVNPFDKSQVEKYIMQFKVMVNGKERVYKEITRRSTPDDFETPDNETNTWIVETFEYQNTWVQTDFQEFPYDFPPIIHWKNLPSIHSVYGMSDIEQIINAQDKYNFIASNNLKITRYHAHPRVYGTGLTKTEKGTWGADEMVLISNADAKIGSVEMQSDLSASRAISQDLRQSLFDLARQVDITSITDKIGALTNFGIRVLYSDSIFKTDTKRELYGEAFAEINRRLLVMADIQPVKCEVVFESALPSNDMEELQIDKEAIAMGIVDKQTVAEKWSKRYGQDWETIQERMTEQQAGESNIGSLLLRRFNQGQ